MEEFQPNWTAIENQYPDVPISLIKDLYDIQKHWNDEQQECFIKCSKSKNWEEWDNKYMGKK